MTGDILICYSINLLSRNLLVEKVVEISIRITVIQAKIPHINSKIYCSSISSTAISANKLHTSLIHASDTQSCMQYNGSVPISNGATPSQRYKNNCPWNACYLSTRHKYIWELTLREMSQTSNNNMAPHSTTRKIRMQGEILLLQ
jgi:hypothetical protein